MEVKLADYKSTIKMWIQYILMFILYFVLHYKFLGNGWFPSDEFDVMCGGKNIASGYMLYGDFYSQHMPFSYYISAVFDFLGAKTVPLQRLSFYGLYAFLWTVINIRYKDVVNKAVLFVYPLIFTSIICCYDMGTVILSEHLAGIGFVILYLELLSFFKKKQLDVFNCVFISISVVLTFGTLFIGVFGVFVIAVAVFIKEFQWRLESKEKPIEMIVSVVKRYALLVGAVAAPWAVLVVSYLLKGNMENFIYQAYELNREIYSKYTGGYGEDIMSTVLSSVDKFTSNFVNLFYFNNISPANIVYILVYVLMAIYIIHLFEKKNAYLGVTTIVFVLATGVRGHFNYHGTHFVAVASLLMSLAIFEVLVQNKKAFSEKAMSYKVAVVMMLFMIFSMYLVSFSVINSSSEALEKTGESYSSLIVETITEEDEAVWQLDFSNQLFMAADRPSICNVGATPWFWEAVGLDTLERIAVDPPRVATFTIWTETWGHKLVEYAPELVAFVTQNYTQYEGTEVYIRNDYYAEACAILEEAKPNFVLE